MLRPRQRHLVVVRRDLAAGELVLMWPGLASAAYADWLRRAYGAHRVEEIPLTTSGVVRTLFRGLHGAAALTDAATARLRLLVTVKRGVGVRFEWPVPASHPNVILVPSADIAGLEIVRRVVENLDSNEEPNTIHIRFRRRRAAPHPDEDDYGDVHYEVNLLTRTGESYTVTLASRLAAAKKRKADIEAVLSG